MDRLKKTALRLAPNMDVKTRQVYMPVGSYRGAGACSRRIYRIYRKFRICGTNVPGTPEHLFFQ